MVDYRDELTPAHRRKQLEQQEGSAAGALIALMVVLLALVVIFWYANSNTPNNGTAGPVIESNEVAPIAPEPPIVSVQ